MNILFSDFIGGSMVKISCFILLQGLLIVIHKKTRSLNQQIHNIYLDLHNRLHNIQYSMFHERIPKFEQRPNKHPNKRPN